MRIWMAVLACWLVCIFFCEGQRDLSENLVVVSWSVMALPCYAYRTWILFLVLLQNIGWNLSSSNYLIGLGSYDITGPAADVNMMGYANMEQTASGVHFRLRARTFIVAEPQGSRVVFVNLDACMASQIVTTKVLERLKARYTLKFSLICWFIFKLCICALIWYCSLESNCGLIAKIHLHVTLSFISIVFLNYLYMYMLMANFINIRQMDLWKNYT